MNTTENEISKNNIQNIIVKNIKTKNLEINTSPRVGKWYYNETYTRSVKNENLLDFLNTVYLEWYSNSNHHVYFYRDINNILYDEEGISNSTGSGKYNNIDNTFTCMYNYGKNSGYLCYIKYNDNHELVEWHTSDTSYIYLVSVDTNPTYMDVGYINGMTYHSVSSPNKYTYDIAEILESLKVNDTIKIYLSDTVTVDCLVIAVEGTTADFYKYTS